MTAPRTELTPEVASLPAQQKPASQRGAFGGRDAVARMFGRADVPDLPPLSETLSRFESLSSDPDISISPAASAETSTAQHAAHEEAESADDARRLREVASDVDNLLAESLDSMLFGEDDTVLHEVSDLGITQSLSQPCCLLSPKAQGGGSCMTISVSTLQGLSQAPSTTGLS